jgi:glucose-6-phosphate 1-epimerase
LSKQATLYGKAGITCDTGINGMARIILTHPSGARVELYRQGAHITSWRKASGAELLFLSSKAIFEAGYPLRGGIPVVFPQFCDNGPLPKHGFARTREWMLADGGQTAAGEVFATLRFEADADTLRLWPFRFTLECSVRLSGDSLAVRLTAANPGALPYRFQVALHTYFQVADIRRTSVFGLKGVEFADSLRSNARNKETRERIEFEGETDRAYLQAPDCLRILDEGNDRMLVIEKNEMRDAVVWNPWVEKSKRMEDFGDDEYQRMVCVETGNIGVPLKLASGAGWEGQTTFSVVPL